MFVCSLHQKSVSYWIRSYLPQTTV